MEEEEKEWTRTYTVTQEEYDAEIASGLTHEEVLRPGTYKVRRNPWAAKLRKAGGAMVRIYDGDKLIKEYWQPMGQTLHSAESDKKG